MQWHPAASLAPLQLLVQVDLLITISMEKDKLKISLKPFFCKEDTNNEMADILGEFNINSKTEKRRKEKISDTKTEMKSVKVAAKPGKGELLTTLPGCGERTARNSPMAGLDSYTEEDMPFHAICPLWSGSCREVACRMLGTFGQDSHFTHMPLNQDLLE
ncbi:hypothetical protein NC651_019325 [Populus alba x Populus x berolinensis]|nr:hypothetical protein NC651_019325 [Populus alba x Populus x berolinensis]